MALLTESEDRILAPPERFGICGTKSTLDCKIIDIQVSTFKALTKFRSLQSAFKLGCEYFLLYLDRRAVRSAQRMNDNP